MNSARGREGSRDRPRLSGLKLIGLGWRGLHKGQRVAADEWLVILLRGLFARAWSAAVWFELDKITSMKNAKLHKELSSQCVRGKNPPHHYEQQHMTTWLSNTLSACICTNTLFPLYLCFATFLLSLRHLRPQSENRVPTENTKCGVPVSVSARNLTHDIMRGFPVSNLYQCEGEPTRALF